MTIEVKVPVLPESVEDATIASWHKQPGEAIARDENLVDLETDKVVLEVPSPADGVLKEILIQDGTTVTSGEVLAGPEILSRGFVYMRDSEELIDLAKERVWEALGHAGPPSAVGSKIKDVLGDLVYAETRRRPMILPLVLQL